MTMTPGDLPPEVKDMALNMLRSSPEVKEFVRGIMVEFSGQMMTTMHRELEKRQDQLYQAQKAEFQEGLKEIAPTIAAQVKVGLQTNGAAASKEPAAARESAPSGQVPPALALFAQLLSGGSGGLGAGSNQGLQGIVSNVALMAEALGKMQTALTAAPMQSYQAGVRDTVYSMGMWGRLDDKDKERLGQQGLSGIPMLKAPAPPPDSPAAVTPASARIVDAAQESARQFPVEPSK